MSDVHDASYYAKCMVGGIFACGLTHAAVCPLDIVKCRRQVSVQHSSLLLLPISIQYMDPHLHRYGQSVAVFTDLMYYVMIGEPHHVHQSWRWLQKDPCCRGP